MIWWKMTELDRLTERTVRRLARRSSRRGWLKAMGAALAGAAAMPLLPVARGQTEASDSLAGVPEQGDAESCDYWRYCAIDGFLCSCCGGSPAACPPGTEMSPITWIGTCRNPADGKSYVISYNDCCGKTPCGQCLCNRNEGDRPMYRPSVNNDINWCLGTSSAVYNCSTAVIIATAET